MPRMSRTALSENARRAYIESYNRKGGLPIWLQQEVGQTLVVRLLPSAIDGESPFLLQGRHSVVLPDQTTLKWVCARMAGTGACPICDWLDEKINPVWRHLRALGASRSPEEEVMFKKAEQWRRVFRLACNYIAHCVNLVEGLESYWGVQLIRFPVASFDKQIKSFYEDGMVDGAPAAGHDIFSWEEGRPLEITKARDSKSNIVQYTYHILDDIVPFDKEEWQAKLKALPWGGDLKLVWRPLPADEVREKVMFVKDPLNPKKK